jgi:hypothetical protein
MIINATLPTFFARYPLIPIKVAAAAALAVHYQFTTATEELKEHGRRPFGNHILPNHQTNP